MMRAVVRRGCRGAVGLLAAYALVLQAFLAYGMAAQAAAHGTSTGSFFVICVTGDDGTATPGQPTTHCPICIDNAQPIAATPDAVELPLPHQRLTGRTPFVSVQACVSFHQARAGLTRAPPQNA